jgi:hypothetical protein
MEIRLIIGIVLVCNSFFFLGQDAFYKVYSASTFDEGFGITEIPGDGYAVVGSTATTEGGANAYIMRINELGEQLWTKTYGGDLSDAARRIIYDPSEGFYVFGYSNSFGDNHFDFYVFKTDLDGELIWETTLGTSDWERLWDAVRLDNGDFVLVGETAGANSLQEDMFVVRMDSNGNELWNMIVQTSGADIAYGVAVLNDTTLVVAGESYNGVGQYPTLMSIHIDGSINWEDTYVDQGSGFFRDVDVWDDFIYVAGGVTIPAEEKISLHMRRFSAEGTETHSSVNNSFDGDSYFCNIQVSAIDRLHVIMLSDAPNLGPFPYGKDQFFLRYNIFLDWFGVSQGYSGYNEDHAHQLIPTSDGGAAFVSSVSDRRNVESFGSSAAVVKIGENYEWEMWYEEEGLLAVSELNHMHVKVFPNPFRELVHIDVPNGSTGYYSIMDISGKVVQTGEVNATIFVGDLTQGTYFIELVFGTELVRLRLVK